MKKSNIIITTVAGIVIGGWSIASWQVGKQIEAKLPAYSKFIQSELWKAIEDRPDLPLQFELVSYKRGLFSSTAQYNILKLPAEYGQFLINVKIEHGPFPLSSLTHFSLRPKVASAHAEFVNSPIISQIKSKATNGKTPLTLDIDFYANNFTFDLSLAPINIKDRKTNFIVKGVRWLGDIQNTKTNSKLVFNIDNIDFKSDSSNFELANFKMDYTFHFSNPYSIFSHGYNQNISIARLKVSGMQNILNSPDININNLNLSGTGTINDKNIDLQSEVQLGDLSIGQLDLGSFNYKANLNNLNAQATESLMTALQKKFTRFSNDAELEEITRNSLISIIEGQPTLAISPLNWKNAKGELTSSFNMAFQMGNPSAPDTFIKSAKFNLNAPRPMLEHSMAQIQALQKYYNREGILSANSPDEEINIARNRITSLKNLKQQFTENEEAREQFLKSNSLPFVIMLASINIDDTKLTSDISYKDGTITVNGGKPKSLNDFIAHPLN